MSEGDLPIIYEVVITRSAVETERIGGQWAEIGVDDDDKKEFGYTPKYDREATVKKEIYRQRAEGLDLVAVIKAINGIV